MKSIKDELLEPEDDDDDWGDGEDNPMPGLMKPLPQIQNDKDDPINPSHYHGTRVMEIIEEFNLGFRLGSSVKYILRAKNKNGIEDLKKALWYLQREIDQISGITAGVITSNYIKGHAKITDRGTLPTNQLYDRT
jgi:hypothetical protein